MTDKIKNTKKSWFSMLRIITVICVLIFASFGIVGFYYLNDYWIHRFDAIIAKQSTIYRLDPKLVWSLIYQETYFRPSSIGAVGEVGLMQVTPTTAREWAKETGIHDFEEQLNKDHVEFMRDPERNIQIGCWYLEKLATRYRDVSEPEARILAAYNAGASRVNEWNKGDTDALLSENEFIKRIDINSTRIYVTEILKRFRATKNP
ncbi:MAG: transglycosylase SLT domain-containing protein [Pyrinomonadaceae bacterium]|nr:transglycosylase SLT domain-containing protein [Pyrinomonadaceae bacterium]